MMTATLALFAFVVNGTLDAIDAICDAVTGKEVDYFSAKIEIFLSDLGILSPVGPDATDPNDWQLGGDFIPYRGR